MTTDTDDSYISLPSDPAQLKRIRGMLDQAVNCEVRMAAERDAKKEIIAEIHKDFEISKKIIGRMVKTMHKHNYSEVQAEMDSFQFAYEKINQA